MPTSEELAMIATLDPNDVRATVFKENPLARQLA
jgi:hypothetical protein